MTAIDELSAVAIEHRLREFGSLIPELEERVSLATSVEDVEAATRAVERARAERIALSNSMRNARYRDQIRVMDAADARQLDENRGTAAVVLEITPLLDRIADLHDEIGRRCVEGRAAGAGAIIEPTTSDGRPREWLPAMRELDDAVAIYRARWGEVVSWAGEQSP